MLDKHLQQLKNEIQFTKDQIESTYVRTAQSDPIFQSMRRHKLSIQLSNLEALLLQNTPNKMEKL